MFRTSIHLAEQIATPREVWLGKASLGELLLQRNQDNEAETQLNQAAQTIEAIAADLRTPRWRDSLLNAAPVVELYDTLGRQPPKGIGLWLSQPLAHDERLRHAQYLQQLGYVRLGPRMMKPCYRRSVKIDIRVSRDLFEGSLELHA